jgi:hypothetical protein
MSESTSATVEDSLPLPAPSRRRWATWLLALVIFFAGAASGAGIAVLVAIKRVQYAVQHPEEAPARISQTLQRRLRLTDDQRSRIEIIVAERQRKLAAIRRRVQPQAVQQLDLVRDEVGEVLTAEQRERWLRMFEDYRTRWLPPLPADTGE